MNASLALSLSILLPLLGAIAALVTGSVNRQRVRQIALGVSIVTLLLALRAVWGFDSTGDRYLAGFLDGSAVRNESGQLQSGDQVFEAARTAYASSERSWLAPSTGMDVSFSLGLDGLSVWMYLLSAVLMLSSVLVSWNAIEDRAALFYSMLLLLEAGCLGVFGARDIIVFYIFFEFTLIPLFFLIGIWGSEDRRYAATKFFLFTLAGSLFTFLGLLTLLLWNHSHSGQPILSCSIPELFVGLSVSPLPSSLQFWVFLALFAGFAIKVPIFPLHTWLPLAHVQAPTAGSVFLAGILLKIGTYGFLRFSIPLLPEASVSWMPWIMWLAVIGIIYGALVALVQTDMKRLIAYSSVSHLGFCMLGMFALTPIGVQGAALQMVNHGISTGALFALVGMLYERYHTREIASFGGLARRLPVMAFFVGLFTFSSIGVPGLNGFVGEILILAGAFQRGWAGAVGELAVQLRWVSVLAVSGVVLGAWYMLWWVQRVFFGSVKEPATAHEVHDLSWREIFALVPLAILVFWIGLYPKFFLDRMAPGLSNATAAAAKLANAAGSLPPAGSDQLAKEDSRRAY